MRAAFKVIVRQSYPRQPFAYDIAMKVLALMELGRARQGALLIRRTMGFGSALSGFIAVRE